MDLSWSISVGNFLVSPLGVAGILLIHQCLGTVNFLSVTIFPHAN